MMDLDAPPLRDLDVEEQLPDLDTPGETPYNPIQEQGVTTSERIATKYLPKNEKAAAEWLAKKPGEGGKPEEIPFANILSAIPGLQVAGAALKLGTDTKAHEYEARPYKGGIAVRPKGSNDPWRVVDPDTGFFSKDILRDAADVLPEAALFAVPGGTALKAAAKLGLAAGAEEAVRREAGKAMGFDDTHGSIALGTLEQAGGGALAGAGGALLGKVGGAVIEKAKQFAPEWVGKLGDVLTWPVEKLKAVVARIRGIPGAVDEKGMSPAFKRYIEEGIGPHEKAMLDAAERELRSPPKPGADVLPSETEKMLDNLDFWTKGEPFESKHIGRTTSRRSERQAGEIVEGVIRTKPQFSTLEELRTATANMSDDELRALARAKNWRIDPDFSSRDQLLKEAFLSQPEVIKGGLGRGPIYNPRLYKLRPVIFDKYAQEPYGGAWGSISHAFEDIPQGKEFIRKFGAMGLTPQDVEGLVRGGDRFVDDLVKSGRLQPGSREEEWLRKAAVFPRDATRKAAIVEESAKRAAERKATPPTSDPLEALKEMAPLPPRALQRISPTAQLAIGGGLGSGGTYLLHQAGLGPLVAGGAAVIGGLHITGRVLQWASRAMQDPMVISGIAAKAGPVGKMGKAILRAFKQHGFSGYQAALTMALQSPEFREAIGGE
jgi:hypothetical protein